MKSRNFIFVLLVFALLITPTLFSQVDYATATLRGTVMDQAGAVVAGATITATNTSTGISKVVKTGSDGAYRLRPCSPAIIRSQRLLRASPRKYSEPWN